MVLVVGFDEVVARLIFWGSYTPCHTSRATTDCYSLCPDVPYVVNKPVAHNYQQPQKDQPVLAEIAGFLDFFSKKDIFTKK